MSSLICYIFGHSLKHLYSHKPKDNPEKPVYIVAIVCRRCDYRMELS